MKSQPSNIIQQAKQNLSEIESLLDQLIESARALLLLSKQVIEEDEFVHLQEKQEKLLEKLIKKDDEFHELPEKLQEDLLDIRLQINEKIDQFQALNAEFIQNINASHGLIQFDKKRLEKPE